MMKTTGRSARGRPPLSAETRATERRRIASIAEALFHSEGFEAVSMRRLAVAAACTPMTLYAYFDNKADILREIWSRMFDDLFEKLERNAASLGDPGRRLAALSTQYVRYWLDHPERYRMVFLTPGVTQGDVGLFVTGSSAIGRFSIFFEAIALCRQELTAPGVTLLGETLVCGLHGIVHSHITISGYPWQDADAQVACLVNALVKA